jgi:hypothetical protein
MMPGLGVRLGMIWNDLKTCQPEGDSGDSESGGSEARHGKHSGSDIIMMTVTWLGSESSLIYIDSTILGPET